MANVATRDTCLYIVSLDENEGKYTLTVVDKLNNNNNTTHIYNKLVVAVSDYNQWVASDFKLNYDGSLKYEKN